MSYRIIIPKSVQKQLNKFLQKQRQRIIESIKFLADVPRPDGVKKLKGYEQTYRIRVGDYRVIYKIEDQEMIILVLSVVHRKDAY
jgi:mRNA interferase RelE/StbE